jgi:hypothetical protein
MQYVYLWTMLIVMLSIVVLCKWHLSLLYLWFIPATVLVYAIAAHTIPHCMQGISACPPHTGAAVEMAGIATVLVFLCLFVLARACFMCAPAEKKSGEGWFGKRGEGGIRLWRGVSFS